MWARAPSPPALRAELHGSSHGQSWRGDGPRYPERPQEWLLYMPVLSNDDFRFWPNGSSRSPGWQCWITWPGERAFYFV